MTKSHSIVLAAMLSFVSATAYAVPDECLPRDLLPADNFRSFTHLADQLQDIEHEVNVPVFLVHEQTLPELLYNGMIQVNRSASESLLLATQEQVSKVHTRGALGISALRVPEGELSNIHYDGEAILIVASRAESDQEFFVQSSDVYFMPGDYSIHMDDVPVWMGVSPALAFTVPSGGLPIGGNENCACSSSFGWTQSIAARSMQLIGMPPSGPHPAIIEPCLSPDPYPEPDPIRPDYIGTHYESLVNRGFETTDLTDVLHDRILTLEYDDCRQRDYPVDIYGRPLTGMVDAGAYYNELSRKTFFIEGDVVYEDWPEPVSAEKCNVTDECDPLQGGGACADDSSSIERTPIQKDCIEGQSSLDPLCEVIVGAQGVHCPNFGDYEQAQRDQCMGVSGHTGLGGVGAFYLPSSCPDDYSLDDLWCDAAIVDPGSSCVDPQHEPPQSQARHQQLYDLKLIAWGCKGYGVFNDTGIAADFGFSPASGPTCTGVGAGCVERSGFKICRDCSQGGDCKETIEPVQGYDWDPTTSSPSTTSMSSGGSPASFTGTQATAGASISAPITPITVNQTTGVPTARHQVSTTVNPQGAQAIALASGADTDEYPVTLTNGAVGFGEVDFDFPGAPHNLSFARSYNSQSDGRGFLGSNWSHNWEKRLIFLEEWNSPGWVSSYCNALKRCLFAVNADGSKSLMIMDPVRGVYVPENGGDSTIRHNSKFHKYYRRFADGRVEVFGTDGELLEDVDRFGNKFVVEHERTPIAAFYTRYCTFNSARNADSTRRDSASVFGLNVAPKHQPYSRKICERMSAGFGKIRLEPLEPKGWVDELKDLRFPDLDGAATATTSSPMYGVYEWEQDGLLGQNFADISATSPASLVAYYNHLKVGLAHAQSLIDVDYGAQNLSGTSMYRVTRVTDPLGRTLDFNYHDDNGPDGLLKSVDGPHGARLEFYYERPDQEPSSVNEAMLTSVIRKPSTSSSVDGAGWDDAFWRQNGGIVKTSIYDYDVAPSYNEFKDDYVDFMSRLVGCRYFAADSCTGEVPIIQEGNPCYESNIKRAQLRSRISDNIIKVWRSDGNQKVVRAQMTYEQDESSMYFDRVTAQIYGAQSNALLSPAVFEYLSAGPTDWSAALEAVAIPLGSNDRTEVSNSEPGGFLLPAELKALYLMESPVTNSGPYRLNEQCDGTGTCTTFATESSIFSEVPKDAAFECHDDHRMHASDVDTWDGEVGCMSENTLSMMTVVPNSIPSYRYFENTETEPGPLEVPTLKRSLLSCDRLAANQLTNIYSNDNIGHFVRTNPNATITDVAQDVLPQYTNNQRALVAKDLRRICSWTKVTERDGSVRYMGHNYQGLRLVQAEQAHDGDLRIVQRAFNADGLMTHETDPFWVSQAPTGPSFETNGLPSRFVHMEYDSDRELDPSAYESGTLRAGVVPQPSGWRRQQNLLRKTYYTPPVEEIQDFGAMWSDTRQQAISTDVAVGRRQVYEYEPFYNQLRLTRFYRLTSDAGGVNEELLKSNEVVFDFSEISATSQALRDELEYQNGLGSNWPVDNPALGNWLTAEFPGLFHSAGDCDLNDDGFCGSRSSFDQQFTTVRGLPILVIETEEISQEERRKYFAWTPNGQVAFERDYVGNQKDFFYFQSGIFGNSSAYSQDFTGLLAKTETKPSPDDPEQADIDHLMIADGLRPNPNLSGAYRFFGDPTGTDSAYGSQSFAGLMADLNVPADLHVELLSHLAPVQKYRLFEYDLHGHRSTESVYVPGSSIPIAMSKWVTDIDGRLIESYENGVTTKRQLNSFGRVEAAEVKDESDLLTAYHGFKYDTRGQVTDHCAAITPDGCSSNWTSVSNAQQAVTTYTYDIMDRLEWACSADGSCTHYYYDAFGRHIKSDVEHLDQNGLYRGLLVAEHVYDVFDRVVQSSVLESGANPRTDYYDYDAFGRLSSHIDTLSTQYQLGYNKFGDRVLDIATSAPLQNGFVFGDFDNFILQVHDGFGHVIRENRHNLQIAEFSVQKDGLPWKVFVEGEGTAYLRYDWDGKPVWQMLPDKSQRLFAFDYDATQNGYELLSTYALVVPAGDDPRTQGTSQTYDPQARVLGQTSYSHDGLLDVSTSMAYVGNQHFYTDPEGKVYEYNRDMLGRYTSVTKPDAMGVTSLTQANVYSPGGRVLESIDESGQSTTYAYDSLNNLVERLLPSGERQEWHYNVFGEPTATNNACNSSRTFTYSASGLLSEVRQGQDILADFAYDPFGRVTAATRYNTPGNTNSGVAQVLLEYDQLGRKTREEVKLDNEPDLVRDINYQTSSNETVVTQFLPHGTVVDMVSLNSKLELSTYVSPQETLDWEFSWNGDKVEEIDAFADTFPVFNEARNFDRRSNLSRWSYGANSVELASAEIQRDSKDRIRGVQFDHGMHNTAEVHGANNSRFWEAYEYDFRNTLASVNLGIGEIESLATPVDNGVIVDHVNSRGGQTSLRSRDAEVGSLLSIDGDDIYGAYPDGIPPGRWISYDSQSNVGRDVGHRIADIGLDGAHSDLGYSCDGQITAALDLVFEYDEFGRLVSVDNRHGTPLERYYYDALGRLAAYEDLTSGEGKQRFVYQRDHMLAAYNPYHHDGSAWTDARWQAVWGPGQDQLLAFVDDDHTADAPRVLNMMRDHRNNVVGAYDAATDSVVGRAHYSAEGRLMAFDTDPNTLWDSDITNVDCQEIGSYIAGADPFVCDSPGGVPFAFNSMWRSPVTGLVYMRNRVYSPRLGQFLSHDPLGYVDSFNLYQFASYDPINKWDPHGLQVGNQMLNWGGGGGGGAATSENVHTALDVVGVVPGPVGAAADVANACMYAAEGNYTDAAISGGSIVGGDILKAAKYGKKAGKFGDDVVEAAGKNADEAAAAGKVANEGVETGAKTADGGKAGGGGDGGGGSGGNRGNGNSDQVDYEVTPEGEAFEKGTRPTAKKESEPAKRVRKNRIAGAKFEKEVLQSLGASKNTQKIPGKNGKNHIPDLEPGAKFGITDAKNVKSLSQSKQLRAFAAEAKKQGIPFNLVVSPRTKKISKPLQEAIEESGGRIFEYNPATGKWRNVATDGNKVIR